MDTELDQRCRAPSRSHDRHAWHLDRCVQQSLVGRGPADRLLAEMIAWIGTTMHACASLLRCDARGRDLTFRCILTKIVYTW
jgi:hypothetical protein